MSTPTGPAAQPAGLADARTPEQIQADLAATRQRLADNLTALSDAVSPAGLRSRAAGRARRVFLDEFGGIRLERVAMATAFVASLVILGRWTRPRHDTTWRNHD